MNVAGRDERDVILRPAEVAAMFHVRVQTLGSWERKGWIKALWTPGRGQRRYRLSEVREALEKSRPTI